MRLGTLCMLAIAVSAGVGNSIECRARRDCLIQDVEGAYDQ
jgi:hypothetical protein